MTLIANFDNFDLVMKQIRKYRKLLYVYAWKHVGTRNLPKGRIDRREHGTKSYDYVISQSTYH